DQFSIGGVDPVSADRNDIKGRLSFGQDFSRAYISFEFAGFVFNKINSLVRIVRIGKRILGGAVAASAAPKDTYGRRYLRQVNRLRCSLRTGYGLIEVKQIKFINILNQM